jgi:hypothetical protein
MKTPSVSPLLIIGFTFLHCRYDYNLLNRQNKVQKGVKISRQWTTVKMQSIV